jgi:hypothetical protein
MNEQSPRDKAQNSKPKAQGTKPKGQGPNMGRFSFVISHFSLILLLLPAAQPLLTTDFTCGYDNSFHLWRSVQIASCLRQGYIYPRWAPDMAHGYGLPLFIFHSPLTAYVAALLNLAGLAWPVAINAVFLVGMLSAGWFIFMLARDLFGPLAGFVAAAAYVYAPFQAYDVFNRGSMSESFAWAFLPLVLWAVHRWAIYRERRFLPLAVAGLAGLVLTHILFAFLCVPLLAAWVFVEGYVTRDWRTIGRGALAGLLGLGACAFFWLPGLAERGWVQTGRLLGTWVFDYRYNFLDLSQLLAPPRIADPTLMNDWPPKALGMFPALIALLPLVRWRGFDRPTRWRVALLLASTIGFAFLTLPVSRPLWDHLPLLPYIQFPWRFLGPAAFCAALLAAASVSGNKSQTPRPKSQIPNPKSPISNLQSPIPNLQSRISDPHSPFSILPTLQSLSLILLIVLGNLGWFYPRHCSPPSDPSTAGLIAWERATDTLGTTAKGEYLPIWVERMPDAGGLTLDAAYAAGGPIVRLRPADLPPGAQILHAEYGAVEAVVELETPVSFQARYLALYYPGWRVTVDGDPVPIAPTDPDGLISFAVPAGRRTVRVRFGETPLRLAADALSLASLIALLVLTLRSRITRHASRFTFHVLRNPHHGSHPHFSFLISHLSLATILLVARLTILDRADSPFRRANLVDGRLRRVDVSTPVTFGDEFVLLGYDALPESVPSGEWFEITTYWRALRPGGPNYGVAVNVIDAQGHHWQGAEIRTPRWHRSPPPVREWPPDQYAVVALSSLLLPGTPPGTYTVEAVAFDRSTLAPLTAHDAGGRALGPTLPLGQVTVTPPQCPADPDLVPIRRRLDTALGPLTLLGADFDRDRAAPGDSVLLTAFWRADRQPRSDLGVRITLLAPDGSAAAEFDRVPTTVYHPTSAWHPGDVWRGQHFLRLPAGLSSGAHRWTLALCRTSDGTGCRSTGEPVALGELQIQAPERAWEVPSLDVETDIQLGNVVTLLGATLTPDVRNLEPGTPLTITLVWRADAEMDTSYRVFVHLLSPDGTLVAQSDGEPANWSRPTTGWLPGEIVPDGRAIAVPDDAGSGEYSLQAGMYTQRSGRLTTSDGAGAIHLGTVTVQDR